MVELTNESRQASRELWESREIQLLYAIANCLLGIKDYIAALEAYRSLLVKDKKNKVALLTGLGRIHLQMGDIPQASAYFKQVEDQVSSSDPQGQSRVLMNRGFMALAESNFELGQDCFKQVSDIDPTNALAINNMAVCSLYTGKLKAAIAILENLLHKDPSTTLQEGVLFNLCTLYELESSQALQKKQALLELVSKHKGNGFNIASLKM
ncbi:trafficking protein particle complex subunit 12-like [Lingula anatina]|nr:trafficking protein particle complex subunit 12-like [Lingula anatina]|eukprot:XP_013387813.1 trafficking protein particle complex subunit 12-like [Lingula anatina]